jgi:O-antigen/teichoic acid export membrane protein
MERSLQRLGFTLIKNALANLVRGGATAVVALALPHFLTRALDHNRFAAWALMLQIAAYVGYLDFGIQTAIARYLAQAVERGDDEGRDRIVSTAFAMLSTAAVVALLLFSIVVWQLPRIIHGVPASLLVDMRGGIIIMAASVALLLPMSTYTGILIGLHRNEFPALAIGGSRILGAFAVIISVKYTHSLIWFAACLATANLSGALGQYFAVRQLLPKLQLALGHVTRDMLVELARYCVGLTVFSFAMLLVSGLDVFIVGHFNFDAVGYYAIAATLITFFSGLSNSCFSALMTPVAVLQERLEDDRIRDLIVKTTRLSSYANLILTFSMFVFGRNLLPVWVGKSYALEALPILEVLLCAQTIRLLGNGYSIALAATGQQKYGISGALIEGSSNLVLSVIGAIWLGPIGVAWGTLIGSVIGVLWMLFFTMRWATGIVVGARFFSEETLLRPFLCLAPLQIFILFFAHQSTVGIRMLYLFLTSVLCVVLSLRWGKVLPEHLYKRLFLARIDAPSR